jgi:polyisoprenoid-binding protein YceI
MIGIFVAASLLSKLASPAFEKKISLDPAKLPGGTYALDERHSQVLFEITHIGLTEFDGRFDKLSGSLDFNSKQPELSSVSIVLDVSSVDTPNAELNEHLKGVFNVTKYPTATFKTVSVARTGPATGTITGDLTLNGVTKTVTLNTNFLGGGVSPMDGANALGFRATAVIHRSDFDLDGMIWSAAVGEDVTLTINALFEQKAK